MLTDSAIQALIGTGVGTVALEVFRQWSRARLARSVAADAADETAREQLLEHLKDELAELKAEQTKMADELATWRGRYLRLLRQNQQLRQQVTESIQRHHPGDPSPLDAAA